MKMGTIASPWRYASAACGPLQSVKLSREITASIHPASTRFNFDGKLCAPKMPIRCRVEAPGKSVAQIGASGGRGQAPWRKMARHGRRRRALLVRRSPIMPRPPRVQIGNAAIPYDFALRLAGGCHPDFSGWSGCPSIAALSINPRDRCDVPLTDSCTAANHVIVLGQDPFIPFGLERQHRDYRECRKGSPGSDAGYCPRRAPTDGLVRLH